MTAEPSEFDRSELEKLRAERVGVSIEQRNDPGNRPPLSSTTRVTLAPVATTVRLTYRGETWEFRCAEFTRSIEVPTHWVEGHAIRRVRELHRRTESRLVAVLDDAGNVVEHGITSDDWPTMWLDEPAVEVMCGECRTDWPCRTIRALDCGNT